MGRALDAYQTIATCVAVLKANEPMTAGDLAVVVGISRSASGWLAPRLRAQPELSSCRRTIRKPGAGFAKAEYFAFGDFPAEPPSVADLWRGWRNPVTGYQPARLGMDEPEAP
jgi:hypothetical protein